MTDADPNNPPEAVWSESLREKRRAGSPAVQRELNAKAWSMLETYRLRGGGTGARLANEWLGSHDWCVQLVDQFLIGHPDCIPLLVPLATAALRRGATTLVGTDVHPEHPRPSAVWRVQADSDSINGFFNANYVFAHSFTLLFPEQLGFAILAAEGEYAVLAGPEDFLREVLPPEALGSAATEALKLELERERGAGWFDAILGHYAPFVLPN
jgi:hypothetical protein